MALGKIRLQQCTADTQKTVWLAFAQNSLKNSRCRCRALLDKMAVTGMLLLCSLQWQFDAASSKRQVVLEDEFTAMIFQLVAM